MKRTYQPLRIAATNDTWRVRVMSRCRRIRRSRAYGARTSRAMLKGFGIVIVYAAAVLGSSFAGAHPSLIICTVLVSECVYLSTVLPTLTYAVTNGAFVAFSAALMISVCLAPDACPLPVALIMTGIAVGFVWWPITTVMKQHLSEVD